MHGSLRWVVRPLGPLAPAVLPRCLDDVLDDGVACSDQVVILVILRVVRIDRLRDLEWRIQFPQGLLPMDEMGDHGFGLGLLLVLAYRVGLGHRSLCPRSCPHLRGGLGPSSSESAVEQCRERHQLLSGERVFGE